MKASSASLGMAAICLACSAGQSPSNSPSTGTGGTAAAGATGAPAAGGVSMGMGGSLPAAAGTVAVGGTPSGGFGSGGVPVSAGGQSVTGAGGVPAGGFPGGGGALAGGGALGSGGSVSGGGSSGSPSGGSPADICSRWKADRANMSEGTWTGNVASCDPGDISSDARANALRVLNLYRFIAGLPPVMDDPARDAKDQQCALMMRANNQLSHMPPMSWTCWTQDGADAANGSNIGTAPAVASMDGYMLDPGNPTTLGHRRWVLSNSLGPVGIGGTDRSSCMMTIGGTGKAGKAWTAWPPPGAVPFQVIGASRFGTVDSTGWSLQSDSINLSAAQVAVTADGAPLAVTVTQLLSGYGSRYALRFNPMGWSAQAGKTYSVSVTGVTPPITYDVQMVDCQ